jgi:hypothetical protein
MNINNDIKESLNILYDFITDKFNLEKIDLSEYDNITSTIRNKLVKHNNIIEEKSWKDDKFNNDKTIFFDNIRNYQKSIQIYENNSYTNFI